MANTKPVSPVVAATVTTVAPDVVVPTETTLDLAPLVAARKLVLNSAKKSGSVIQEYAKIMCGLFDVKELSTGRTLTHWYDLVGKAARPARAEKEAFFAMFEEAKFDKPTVTVYWARVKAASGYQTKGERVTASLSVDDKTTAELATIIRRIQAAQEAGTMCNKSEDVLDTLKEVFRDMGGDEDKLK